MNIDMHIAEIEAMPSDESTNRDTRQTLFMPHRTAIPITCSKCRQWKKVDMYVRNVFGKEQIADNQAVISLVDRLTCLPTLKKQLPSLVHVLEQAATILKSNHSIGLHHLQQRLALSEHHSTTL
jgi:hypothetical protein